MEVGLFVNSKCNAGCKHCYIEYSGERSPENTLETVKQLQSLGHKVTIAGSEVLLNPEYLKSYQQAGHDRVLTNGIILDQDKSLYDLLRAYGIEKLVFSIHFGIEKNLKSVPEELVARVIRESKMRGFVVWVLTVITPQNYDSIAEMCKRVAEYEVDTFYPMQIVAHKPELSGLTPKQLEIFFSEIAKIKEQYSKSDLEIKLRGNFGPRPGSKKSEKAAKKNKFCPAGKDLVVIDPQNNVYGCPFLMQEKNIIGKYKDGEIIIEKDLLDGKRDTCIAHLLT